MKANDNPTLEAIDTIQRKLSQARAIVLTLQAHFLSEGDRINNVSIADSLSVISDLIEEADKASERLEIEPARESA